MSTDNLQDGEIHLYTGGLSESVFVLKIVQVLLTWTYTFTGHIALPSTHSSSSSLMVGIKATPGFVANPEMKI